MKLDVRIENQNYCGQARRNALEKLAATAADLNDAVEKIHAHIKFRRFLVGRGGSHVWVSLKNGQRIAVLQEVAA